MTKFHMTRNTRTIMEKTKIIESVSNCTNNVERMATTARNSIETKSTINHLLRVWSRFSNRPLIVSKEVGRVTKLITSISACSPFLTSVVRMALILLVCESTFAYCSSIDFSKCVILTTKIAIISAIRLTYGIRNV